VSSGPNQSEEVYFVLTSPGRDRDKLREESLFAQIQEERDSSATSVNGNNNILSFCAACEAVGCNTLLSTL
jgi:hypothetical protein